ncbi:MAG: lamin tail domain-containing protein [Bacteroidales bacterium]
MQNPVVSYNLPGVYDVELSVSNSVGTNSILFEDYITVLDQSPVLMITEIMQNPSAVLDENGEWFEVFNPTNSPIDMNGWYLKDNGVDSIRINSSVIIPPNGFVTLGLKSDNGINGNYVCNYEYSNFFLSNGADEIVLFNAGEEEVDRVEYDGGPNWPDPNGASMIFTGNSTADNNLASNWSTATAREPSYSGTFTDKGSPGTNGAGQNLITSGFALHVEVFLQGPFEESEMSTYLNSAGRLPISQPFNGLPWNYSGDESVAAIPNPDVVDWVLIELRDASDVLQADHNSVIGRRAAFLLKNGLVTDLDGSTNLQFSISISQQLFVVIQHRNHIEIISENGLSESAGVYSYDFTFSQLQAHNDGQIEIAPGVWGMIAADSDASGFIDDADKDPLWDNQTGTAGYLESDSNLDTQINNQDKNDFWFPNQGSGSQVPD